MPKFIEIMVTYIDKSDLIIEAANLPIEDITLYHVKNRYVIMKAILLVLKFEGEYKVLKSKL